MVGMWHQRQIYLGLQMVAQSSAGGTWVQADGQESLKTGLCASCSHADTWYKLTWILSAVIYHI